MASIQLGEVGAPIIGNAGNATATRSLAGHLEQNRKVIPARSLGAGKSMTREVGVPPIIKFGINTAIHWLFHREKPKNGEPLRFCHETALKYIGDECLIWPFARDSRGYGYVYADGQTKIVSRYICEQAIGPAPTQSHEAAHSCGNGNGGCITPRHLRWATPKENSADRIIHGTSGKGEKNAMAKRTESEIREIRRLYEHGMKNKDICKLLGICSSQVSTIVHRKAWASLNEDAS